MESTHPHLILSPANAHLAPPLCCQAGRNTSTEVAMDVYLADQFGNRLVPGLAGVRTLLESLMSFLPMKP